MVPDQPGFAQLYLTGSSGGDVAQRDLPPGPPAAVTFHLAAGSFDESPAAAAGCAVAASDATCTLRRAARLDRPRRAWTATTDLGASGFPSHVTAISLGGEGSDTLSGGRASEDVLVDGPGDGARPAHRSRRRRRPAPQRRRRPAASAATATTSSSRSRSATATTSAAAAGRDNASWAQAAAKASGANLGSGKAGRTGAGAARRAAPAAASTPCRRSRTSRARKPATSSTATAGRNQLLGHKGPDTYSAAAGADTILANSGDADPAIDCGADVDRALIDHPAVRRCRRRSTARPCARRTRTASSSCPTSRSRPRLPGGHRLPPPVAPKPPVRHARDRRPPQTRITARPRPVLTHARSRRRVVFRFAANEPGSTFRCKLDRKPYRPCASPRVYIAPARQARDPHLRHRRRRQRRLAPRLMLRVRVRRR